MCYVSVLVDYCMQQVYLFWGSWHSRVLHQVSFHQAVRGIPCGAERLVSHLGCYQTSGWIGRTSCSNTSIGGQKLNIMHVQKYARLFPIFTQPPAHSHKLSSPTVLSRNSLIWLRSIQFPIPGKEEEFVIFKELAGLLLLRLCLMLG